MAQRQNRHHNEIAWGAWHTAALQRSKKLPKLKELISGGVAPKRRQTVEEQIAIAMQWTRKLTKH